jgi:hypothetical protein
LTCDDDGMWSWIFIDDDEDACVKMRTGDRGEGIWALIPGNSWTVDSDGERHPEYLWQQQTGTGQFSLSGCTHSAARGRILREYCPDF